LVPKPKTVASEFGGTHTVTDWVKVTCHACKGVGNYKEPVGPPDSKF